MRRFVILLLALLAVLTIAGCAAAPGSSDPYDIARKAMDAKWDSVQVDIGINAKDSKSTIKIDPGAIRFVVDSKAGKALVHVALPIADLGADASSLKALGVTGDSIDVDVVYDGSALYAKSPVLGSLLGAMLAQSGQMPSGDMTGWLRLGTKEDLASLGAGAIESAKPELPSASLDAAALRKDLEANGVTLTFVATEQKNGVDANHLKVAIDVSKLSDSKAFDGLTRTQLDQVKAMAKAGTISGDIWIDKGSNRVVELDFHIAGAGSDTSTGDVTVSLKTPDAGTSFDAPAKYTDLPVKSLLGTFMQMLGSSMLGG
jgi:hypothetical protein